MRNEDVTRALQEISEIVRYRGIYADYERCATLIGHMLNVYDPVAINDVLMNFSGAVYLKDLCSDYQWCSASYASMLALGDPQLIKGHNDFDFGLDIHMATEVQEADELALIYGRPTSEEREVRLPDSTVRVLRTKRFPIYHEGVIIGLLGLVKEVFVKEAPKQPVVELLPVQQGVTQVPM